MARSPPTRITFRSSSTRSSLACAGSGSSPTSSRNSVPPPAFSNAPRRSRSAPVNAPRSWPNSSLSTSCSGSAALLTATSGVLAPGPRRCSSRATSSLPVPLSPTISTLLGIGATRAIASRSDRIGALSPMSGVSPSNRDRSERNLLHQPPARDRVLDLLNDALDRLRLVDEPVGAEPHGLDAAVVAAGAGVDDDRRVDAALLQPPQHFEAVDARHLEIEDDAVDRLAGQDVERLVAAGGDESCGSRRRASGRRRTARPSPARRRPPARASSCARRTSGRNVDDDARALAGALSTPIVPFEVHHQPPDDGQAQPGAALFRRVEIVEDPLRLVGGHPAAACRRPSPG